MTARFSEAEYDLMNIRAGLGNKMRIRPPKAFVKIFNRLARHLKHMLGNGLLNWRLGFLNNFTIYYKNVRSSRDKFASE